MGKQARAKAARRAERRQTAYTASASSHTARSAQQQQSSSSPKPPQAPDPDELHELSADDAIPIAINVHRMETERRQRDPNAARANRKLGGTLGTYAGGLKWSPAFAEYIARALPADVAAMQANWREWWRNPYLVHGVRKRLGSQVTDALLALYASDRDYTATAQHVGKSFHWLARHEPIAWRIAQEVAAGRARAR